MTRQKKPRPQQLALLTARRVPKALQLDDRTRRIGLAGVAEAKAILDEQVRRRAEQESTTTTRFVRSAA